VQFGRSTQKGDGMSRKILKQILGLLVLCLVISVVSNAGTIPINFAVVQAALPLWSAVAISP
jgi:hypothetical protein